MKKLQLKKEIVQDLDMLKIRGGDDTTTTRTIIGDSGGTNCGCTSSHLKAHDF